MPLHLNDLATQLDHLTGSFTNAFSELSSQQLNWKPNEATWSIAQNIDHIMVINRSYYPLVASLRNGTLSLPRWGRWKGAVNWFGKMIYNSVEPSRRRKMKTFPIWEPSQSELPFDILAQFEQHQKEFTRFILECRDLVEQDAVIHSPANRNIVYSLSKAFDIIVLHERRHLEQALEVKKLLPSG